MNDGMPYGSGLTPEQRLARVEQRMSTGGGGVTAHSALTGLAGDDHLQYHTDARGDVRYYTKAQTTALALSAFGVATASIALGGFKFTGAADATGAGEFLTYAQAVRHAIAVAKGDLVTATGVGAFSRTAVGADGTILVASSAAAGGVAWSTATSAGIAVLASPALTGVPTAPTAAPGTATTQIATMAALQDAVGSMSSTRPSARVGRTTVYAVPASTLNAAIPFDQEQLDTDGMVTISGTTDRITCVSPGVYVAAGNIGWSANAGGTLRGVRIAHYNSAGTLQKAYGGSAHSGAGAGATPSSTVSAIVSMAAGDYLRLEAYQDIAGTLSTAVALSSDHANLAAVWAGGTGAAWGNAGTKVWKSGNQTLTAATWADITWDSEAFDIDGMHSTSSNTERLTCTVAGTYQVNTHAMFASTASAVNIEHRVRHYTSAGVLIAEVHYDARTVPAKAAANYDMLGGAFDVQMSVGDYLVMGMYSNVAHTAVGGAQGYTTMSAVRVGYQTNPADALAVWTTVAEARTYHGGAAGAQWFTGNGPLPNAGNAYALDIPLFPFDPADYAVAGKTLQGRLVVSVIGNATAATPATLSSVYLTNVASTSGTGANSNWTMGTAYCSTSAITLGAGNNALTKGPATSLAAMPATNYGFGFTGSGTFAAGAAVVLGVQFQIRHV